MHCVCNVKLLCEWPGFEPGCFPKMVVVRKIIGPRHHEVELWHVLNLEKNLENKLAAPSVGEFGNNRTQTVDISIKYEFFLNIAPLGRLVRYDFYILYYK